MCSEDDLFMKKLIGFIKDNPFVEGNPLTLTLLPRYVSRTIQLHMCSFCEKKYLI